MSSLTLVTATRNLKSQRVWLFSGTQDTVVQPGTYTSHSLNGILTYVRHRCGAQARTVLPLLRAQRADRDRVRRQRGTRPGDRSLRPPVLLFGRSVHQQLSLRRCGHAVAMDAEISAQTSCQCFALECKPIRQSFLTPTNHTHSASPVQVYVINQGQYTPFNLAPRDLSLADKAYVYVPQSCLDAGQC
jgi:hypothetical protein